MNILLFDNNVIFRTGLKTILTSLINDCYLFEADNLVNVKRILKSQKINLVFTEFNDAKLDGYDIVTNIRSEFSEVLMIILTQSKEKSKIRQAIKYGINGYLIKDSDKLEIEAAINVILGGRQYISPKIYNIWLEVIKEMNTMILNKTVSLTPKEKTIVKMICNQHTTKEIASLLNVSDLTIKNHRNNILKKLEVNNLVGVVLYAIKNEIIVI